MPPFKKPNLKLLPSLATVLQRSSEELDVPISTLIRLLVRNDQLAPAKLAALAADPRVTRQGVSLSMSIAVQRWVRAGAKRNSLSQNAYIEALIDQHAAHSDPFVILRGRP